MFLFDICPFLMHAYDMWCDFISSYEPTLVKSYKDYRNVVNVSSIYTLYSLKPTDTCTITHRKQKKEILISFPFSYNTLWHSQHTSIKRRNPYATCLWTISLLFTYPPFLYSDLVVIAVVVNFFLVMSPCHVSMHHAWKNRLQVDMPFSGDWLKAI